MGITEIIEEEETAKVQTDYEESKDNMEIDIQSNVASYEQEEQEVESVHDNMYDKVVVGESAGRPNDVEEVYGEKELSANEAIISHETTERYLDEVIEILE